jgi:hypothetical protein
VDLRKTICVVFKRTNNTNLKKIQMQLYVSNFFKGIRNDAC